MSKDKSNLELLASEITKSFLGTNVESEFNSLCDLDGTDNFSDKITEFKDKYFPSIVLVEAKTMNDLYGDGDEYDTPSKFEQTLEYVVKDKFEIESKGDVDWYVSKDGTKKYGVWDNNISKGLIFKSALKESDETKGIEFVLESLTDDDIKNISIDTSLEDCNDISCVLIEMKNGDLSSINKLNESVKNKLNSRLSKLVEIATRPFSRTLKVNPISFDKWKSNIDGLTIERGSSNKNIWRGWNTASKAPIFVYNSETQEFSTDEADDKALPLTESNDINVGSDIFIDDKQAKIIYKDGDTFGYKTDDGEQDIFTKGDKRVVLMESVDTNRVKNTIERIKREIKLLKEKSKEKESLLINYNSLLINYQKYENIIKKYKDKHNGFNVIEDVYVEYNRLPAMIEFKVLSDNETMKQFIDEIKKLSKELKAHTRINESSGTTSFIISF